MLTLFDRYILKSLLQITLITAGVLSAIILLTQSLKFLELIINAGASSGTFWILSLLALPRLFEIVLPISMMIGTLFLYNRLSTDSELTVMRATGQPPINLARPVLITGLLITTLLIFITTWLAPSSLTQMKQMRQVIKSQYSTLLFREGIFNEIGKDIIVYIDKRQKDGTLEGLLVHDSRPELEYPTTILAKRGVIVADDTTQQVVVYNGSRQVFNQDNEILQRLDFERYTIDLPENDVVTMRWKEPDERTFLELLNPDLTNKLDREYKREMMIESHKRIVGPFLTIGFSMMALCFLILGPISRRGQGNRLFFAVITIVVLQGIYLATFNIAQEINVGLVVMYLSVFAPIVTFFILLSPIGDAMRHSLLFIFSRQRKS